MAQEIKKIAVIGGGFAGLMCLVSLEEEGGFDPVCFEKADKPGGTWLYREEAEDGFASIMPTTTLNHSKELGAFSNFPPKKESNNYMSHPEIYEYMIDYAKSSDVLKYIQYNMEVSQVRRSDDYEETGKWTVTVKNRVSGKISTDIYDGVLVCIGHVNRPKMPTYPGQDLFKGKVMHTHSLKGVDPYKDKIVVVVGMGCSGLDAAVDTCNVAKQVYLSTRCGAHVISRVGQNGLPSDVILLRRYLCYLIDFFTPKIASWFLENAYLDLQFDQKMYAVRPNHNVLEKDPSLNDYIGSKLHSGAVIQKPGIRRFTENGVIFEGDEKATDCDVVIMATGYTWKFPFLEEDIVTSEGGKINLYKCIYPPHLPHSSLAIIGFLLTWGPSFTCGELQARWVIQVLAGKCKLPSKELMLEDIEKRYAYNLSRYGESEKTLVHVDVMQYCDELASLMGAKPNFFKLFFTDPKLFMKLIFGPCVSYQYRLQGPHPWEGARDAVMTTMERVVWPMTKKQPEEVQNGFFKRIIKKIVYFIFF